MREVTFPLFLFFGWNNFFFCFSFFSFSSSPFKKKKAVAVTELERKEKKVLGCESFFFFFLVCHPRFLNPVLVQDHPRKKIAILKKKKWSNARKADNKKSGKKKNKIEFQVFISSLSYPEGNFGGNQQLDGSMGLSPLYPSCTNDLHVSIETSFHQSFLWLHSTQA